MATETIIGREIDWIEGDGGTQFAEGFGGLK